MIRRVRSDNIYSRLLCNSETIKAAISAILIAFSFIWGNSNRNPEWIAHAAAIAALCLTGLPIVSGAVKGLLNKEINVDELVSIAIIAGVLTGEFLSAAVVSLIMVTGALIEDAAGAKARDAIKSLVQCTPETSTIIKNDQMITVNTKDVQLGDMLLIKPGDRIPADAVIRRGSSTLDESAMTGESRPIDKSEGDTVFAGTLNHTGVLHAEAIKIGRDTAMGKIIQLVTEAEAYKPRAVNTIDRFAVWFTPTVLLCSLAAWVTTGDYHRAITVLIVGCPCALILAAPAAVVATIGRLARQGVLVRGGLHLEEAAAANAILFDKTGTLTEGEPRVERVDVADGILAEDVLANAASVEQGSSHPLAKAVLKAAGYARIKLAEAEEFVSVVGLGARALVQGNQIEIGSAYMGAESTAANPLFPVISSIKESGSTPLVVYKNKAPIGVISVADQIRRNAPGAIIRLKSLGISRIGVVSGDHKKAAEKIAEEIGISEVWSHLTPSEKLEVIKEIQNNGERVIYVGDGINDAPALASANVGVAMGKSGTDVALDTADVVLLDDDIDKLPILITSSRQMVTTIKWSIALGLFFNLAAILAAGGGLLSPIMGAVAHNAGSIIVVLLSARLAWLK